MFTITTNLLLKNDGNDSYFSPLRHRCGLRYSFQPAHMKTCNHHLHRFPHKTCLLIRLKNIFIDRTLSLLFTTYGSKFHHDICRFCKKRIFKNPSISFYKCLQIANMTTKLIWLRCDGYRKIFGITQSFSNQAQSYTLITSLIFLFDTLIFFQLYRD